MIEALVFHPDGTQSLYSKQHLHPGEESVITAGTGGETLAIDNRAIALAICADAMQSSHRANACKAGADIYAAGVLISPASYAAESKQLADYAKTDRMMILLANHGGASGGWRMAMRRPQRHLVKLRRIDQCRKRSRSVSCDRTRKRIGRMDWQGHQCGA